MFDEWLETLHDKRARSKLVKRSEFMEMGNFGKTRAVGQGVIESKIEEGPGYRLYFAHYGPVVVLLICGGDKSDQDSDIKFAQNCWARWKKEQKHEAQKLRSK
ncbi:MAG: type II toxin-antitoxin system RelE/ParE family toxin [Actinomycetaceae bacterium]|nr:type II toxin-antitoxin system RelE/ParE family toxin [Actinomycetaceae bacterium]